MGTRAESSKQLMLAVAAVALACVIGAAWLAGPPPRVSALAGEASLASSDDGRWAVLQTGDVAVTHEAAAQRTRQSVRSTDARKLSRWTGRVEDAHSGEPVAGATVRVSRGKGEENADEIVTGGDGVFALDVERARGNALLVAHPDFVDLREAEPRLDDGRVLTLSASGRIEGLALVAGVGVREGLGVALWPSQGQRFDGPPLQRTEPDGEGAFRFDDLAPGRYGVAALGAGPLLFEDGIEVRAGKTTNVRLTVPRGLALAGRVVVGERQEPVAGARITVLPEVQGINDGVERLAQQVVHSGDDGRFAVTGLAQGGVDVGVRAPWGVELNRRQNIAPESLGQERVFVLPSPARISGIVRDPSGAPTRAFVAALAGRGTRGAVQRIMDAAASGSLDGLGEFSWTRTEADGRFVLDPAPGGYGEVWAFALPLEDPEGLGPAASSLGPVGAGAAIRNVELTLSRASAVSGCVVDQAGEPLANVRVRLYLNAVDQNLRVDEVTTEASGEFSFARAVLEHSRLLATADGYRGQWFDLDDSKSGEPIVLELRDARGLTGRVVDTRGAAVAGVTVTARRDRRNAHTARTDEFGRFMIQRLRSGPYDLMAEGPGIESLGNESIAFPTTEEVVLVVERVERPTPVSLGGTAFDADTGTSIPNLRLDGVGTSLVRIDGPRFDVQGMQPGQASVVLNARGYERLALPAREYRTGEHVELGTFELWPGGRLWLRVRDENGRDVERATARLVSLAKSEGGAGSERGPLTLRWNRRGRSWPYRIDDVPRRTFVLEVQRRGYETHRETLTIERDTRRTVRLRRTAQSDQ